MFGFEDVKSIRALFLPTRSAIQVSRRIAMMTKRQEKKDTGLIKV